MQSPSGSTLTVFMSVWPFFFNHTHTRPPSWNFGENGEKMAKKAKNMPGFVISNEEYMLLVSKPLVLYISITGCLIKLYFEQTATILDFGALLLKMAKKDQK